jgi:hypothetical protein
MPALIMLTSGFPFKPKVPSVISIDLLNLNKNHTIKWQQKARQWKHFDFDVVENDI